MGSHVGSPGNCAGVEGSAGHWRDGPGIAISKKPVCYGEYCGTPGSFPTDSHRVTHPNHAVECERAPQQPPHAPAALTAISTT